MLWHKRLESFSSCSILKKISGKDPCRLASGQLLWPRPGELATVLGSPFKHHMIDVREEQVPKDMRWEMDKQQVSSPVSPYLQPGYDRDPFHTGFMWIVSAHRTLIPLAVSQAKYRTQSSCSSNMNRSSLARTPHLGILWCSHLHWALAKQEMLGISMHVADHGIQVCQVPGI